MRSTQFFTVLALLVASASSMSIAVPANNLARRGHGSEAHNAVLQARAARMRNMARVSEEADLASKPDIPRRIRKRGINARRCAPKSSSSALPSSTVSPVANVADPTTSSTPESKPTSTSVKTTSSAKPTSEAEPTTTKTKAATKTSSTAKESATPDSSSSSSGSGETFTGEATFYGTGLGACGITNKDTDYICAVSQLLFDGFEGYAGGNPNANPICGRKLIATYKGKSVTVTVTDRCVGCAKNDLDFAPSAFDQLADESLGRLQGMNWKWA